MRPKRSTEAAIRRSTEAASSTLAGNATASPPMSVASTRNGSSLRAATTTLAPARARDRAVCFPMPLLAPTTTATWSFSA